MEPLGRPRQEEGQVHSQALDFIKVLGTCRTVSLRPPLLHVKSAPLSGFLITLTTLATHFLADFLVS
jgi:hypothetical protein